MASEARWPDRAPLLGPVMTVAIAPLAALAGYTTALRSLTQGHAMANMVFHGYEEARAA